MAGQYLWPMSPFWPEVQNPTPRRRAYLLARLALDRQLQGQGLGTQLLLDAAELVLTASTSGGGRLLVVDAIDDRAAAFYRAHGFLDITGTNRLYLSISALRHMPSAP